MNDPLAAALGNASFLGAGYLLLGRRRLAVATGLVTVVLLALLGWVFREVWTEVVVVLWWAALIVHGYVLAGGRGQPVANRGQRLIALAVTVPVLLAAGFLRLDATLIGRDVDQARRSGDCAQARSALDRAWLGDRLADAPLAARGDLTVEACRHLRRADDYFSDARHSDIGALKNGFDTLGAVLNGYPGHSRMAGTVLDDFLGRLPTEDLCLTVKLTDWLRARPVTHDLLDRSAAVAARVAPSALTGCGDVLMAAKDWPEARARYRQLLEQYPGDGHTTRAQAAIKQATLAMELEKVRELLRGSTGTTQPDYCTDPAGYSAAPPPRKGANRALFYGNNQYTNKLPATWKATDATRAALIVCVDEEAYGTAVRTCPYQSKLFRQFPTQVTFHKIALRVRVYALRTGKLVANRKLQVSGKSCPRTLRYTYYATDIGPPSQVYVAASRAGIRSAFRPLVVR